MRNLSYLQLGRPAAAGNIKVNGLGTIQMSQDDYKSWSDKAFGGYVYVRPGEPVNGQEMWLVDNFGV